MGDDQVLTYGELAGRQETLTNTLAERFRIGRGDRVVVSLPNCWQFAALLFSVTDLGAVFIPINPNWRSSEHKWCVDNLRPSLVVTGGDKTACWEEIGYPINRVVTAELITSLSAGDCASPKPTPPSFPDPDDHALYFLTSGSTGFPKVAPRSHRNLVIAVRNMDAALGGIGGRRFLGVVPFHHAHGFANSLLLPLLTGGSVLVVPSFLPHLLTGELKHFRPHVLMGSPFIYRILSEKAGADHGLDGLEICLSSGAAIPCELVRQWRDRFGVRIRQLYGSSETGTISIEMPCAPLDRLTAGQPLPNVEVRIDPAFGRDEGCGEILVRSPAAMSGYLFSSNEGGTFLDGFFRTGDLGRFDDDGNIVIQGRRKRIINLMGLKVDPVEIENLIRGIPGVTDCLVTPAGEEGGCEIIKALVCVGEGFSLTRGDLIECCRSRLAEYKIPRVLEITDSIPEDMLGKRSLY